MRLIDANALLEALQDEFSPCDEVNYFDVKDLIDNAPTVIEGSKDE